ncbi:MAG: hypothetical protein HYX21_03070 [Candidatus Yanofskybacteria bacterium]|nr:hypothetical protein [Candidatus Yanofskybacteria bacterium]
MKKILSYSLLVFCFLAVWPTSVFSADLPSEFMSLAELDNLLRAGPVNAFFETVPKGMWPRDIRKFKVQIQGIHRMPGLGVVMFTTKVKIAAGMSGSPVYVKGKLVGALAYSFNKFAFNQLSWGGISSAELMYYDQLGSATAGLQRLQSVKSFIYEGKTFTPIALGDESLSFSSFVQVQAGFPELAGMLKSQKFVFSQVQSSDSHGTNVLRVEKAALKAGMPIMVDLLEWTDQSGKRTLLGVIGTITYIDKKSGRIYAFGHPFLGAKKIKYTFRTYNIIGTVFSEGGSFKLSGDSSEPLGLIDFDSNYGIYGNLSLDGLEKLHSLYLELKKQGQTYNNFSVRIADHQALVPLIVGGVLGLIGETNDTPLSNEPSVTELESKISIENFQPVESKQISYSDSSSFGDRVIYSSSYKVAISRFIHGIYAPLFFSNYNFKISNVELAANFIPGRPQELKLVAYKLPSKVAWGEDPVLEILLVNETNTMAFEKKMAIPINWSEVEEPVYFRETRDLEKEPEKIINAVVKIFGADVAKTLLSGKEKQDLFPDYFLGPEDFLKSFSGRLRFADKGLFGAVAVRVKSGLAEEKVANAESVVTDQAEYVEGWHMMEGGIKSRKATIKSENFVKFNIPFPPIPSGYVIDPDLSETAVFEVVKKTE